MRWWPFASRHDPDPVPAIPTLADYFSAARLNDEARRLALLGAIQAMLGVIDQLDGLARLEAPSLRFTAPYPAAKRLRLLRGLDDARQRTQALLNGLDVTLPAQDVRSVMRQSLHQLSDELAEMQQRFAHGYGLAAGLRASPATTSDTMHHEEGATMSQLGITRDLHLGLAGQATLWDLHRRLASELCNLTVLAGDLGEPLDQFVACLDIFHGLPGNVAVPAGNHDLWARGRWSSQDLWTHEIPQAVQARGMCYLETTEWRAGDLAVLGAIAWYDYPAADPHGPAYSGDDFVIAKRLLNNDACFLNWAWSDPEFARQVAENCMIRLAALEDDPSVRDMLRITHVPLCESQLVRKPEDEQWGIITAFFGNLILGQQALAVPKVHAIRANFPWPRRSRCIKLCSAVASTSAIFAISCGALGRLNRRGRSGMPPVARPPSSIACVRSARRPWPAGGKEQTDGYHACVSHRRLRHHRGGREDFAGPPSRHRLVEPAGRGDGTR